MQPWHLRTYQQGLPLQHSFLAFMMTMFRSWKFQFIVDKFCTMQRWIQLTSGWICVALSSTQSLTMLFVVYLYYSGGVNPISPYAWAGVHAPEYDPEANNAWGDLPMKRGDIKKAEPSNEFEAPKVSSVTLLSKFVQGGNQPLLPNALSSPTGYGKELRQGRQLRR